MHHLLLLLLFFLEIVLIQLRKFYLINEMVISLFGINDLLDSKLKWLVVNFLVQRKLIDYVAN